MKKKYIIILLIVFLLPPTTNAQRGYRVNHTQWSYGLGAGYRISFMKITEFGPAIENYYKFTNSNYIFSLFAYKEYGDGYFAWRPQISMLKRGGEYHFCSTLNCSNYTVKASYLDFRIPIIINFTEYNRDHLQPYFYITPIFGIATGGKLRLRNVDHDVEIIETKITQANIAKYYYGIGASLGVRYNIDVKKRNVFVGMEIVYDYGFSDTYSEYEKKGEINNIGNLVPYYNEPLKGSRHFSGLEMQVVAGVPLSIFKHTKNKLNDTPAPSKSTPPTNKTIPNTTKAADTTAQITTKDSIVNNTDNIAENVVSTDTIAESTKDTISNINPENLEDYYKKYNTITFSFNSTDIISENRAYLDNLAIMLKKTGAKIKVIGHTDNRGSYAYNITLSRQRATTVMEYLIKQGVDREKISAEGFGSNRPIADNRTEQGRAQNRRVEFDITE